MTKTEAKQKAQDLLLQCAQNVAYHVGDAQMTEQEKAQVLKAAQEQLDRIGKLFGYNTPVRMA